MMKPQRDLTKFKEFAQKTGNDPKLLSIVDGKIHYSGGFYCYYNQLTTLDGAPETVGGDFNCNSNQLTTLDGAPETVGGDFYCYNNAKSLNPPNTKKPIEGKEYGNKWIYKDGWLIPYLSKREIDGFTFYQGRIKGRSLLIDEKGNSAHGTTAKQCRADLIFKTTKRDNSKYRSYTLDTALTFEEAYTAYRDITGACAAGTQDFISRNGLEDRESFTLQEIFGLTRTAYRGDVFRKFFEDAWGNAA